MQRPEAFGVKQLKVSLRVALVGAMEALVRRPDTVARLLAQPWARAVAVSALRALPAALAAAAQQFAETYPKVKVKVRARSREQV